MPGCSHTNTAGADEDDFDQREDLIEQLRHGPAATQPAQPALSPPAPPRWTLQTIRAQVPWLRPYTLSGVWRVLQRCKLKLRTARLRMYSPDPAYCAKETELLRCLHTAAHAPSEHVVLFLDEIDRVLSTLAPTLR